MILKACIDFMSGKIIRMFSQLINPSHCRYGSKLITAEVMTFHLVTGQIRESRFAVSADSETTASLVITIITH